jgi:hypothetical protein
MLLGIHTQQTVQTLFPLVITLQERVFKMAPMAVGQKRQFPLVVEILLI